MNRPSPMELLAQRVFRDATIARRRSLVRRAGGPLVKKYLEVVPFVFTARGEFGAFRLLLRPEDALARLRDRAVLTLDSATELLGGFRFGRNRNIYAYFTEPDDLIAIARSGVAERRPGTSFPLSWAPPGWEMLFAVVPPEMPQAIERGGYQIAAPERLICDLIGFYGLRTDLLAEIESKLLQHSGDRPEGSGAI